jgi:DNA transformation protein and related proteins
MSSSEIDTFLKESIEDAIGPVSFRKMFGGIGVWSGNVFIAMISDGALLIRLAEKEESDVLEAGFVPNDPSSAGKGRKRYYEVPADVIENRDELEPWLRKSIDLARRS